MKSGYTKKERENDEKGYTPVENHENNEYLRQNQFFLPFKKETF